MTGPIVVGLALREDDRAPIALAEMLARLAGAPIALTTSYPYGADRAGVRPRWVDEARERAEAVLRDVGATLTGDVEWTTHVRPELSAALALHDTAIALDGSAIVIGSSHRGAVGRMLIGSVGAGLLHGAPCPVAIAPRGYAGAAGFRRIGAAFVDTPEGRSALTAATGIAGAAGGQVEVVTVTEPMLWAPALGTPGWSVPRAAKADRDAHAWQAAEKAARIVPAGLLASVEVKEGNAPAVLAERSADLDLLICGSRGYGPIRSVVLGSVARTLAHEARCPLLIVPRSPAADATPLWRRRPADRQVDA